ncbi:hypothetical protein HI914_04136 [Erysiphe necator]|nr:hypothetical protein HI914_04136 [Erysiphe necator]
MFTAALHEAQKCVRSAQYIDVILSPQFLPSTYSITAISKEVLPKEPPEDLLEKHKIILLINTCLSQVGRLSRQPTPILHTDNGEDNNEITAILRIIFTASKIIRPNGNLFLSDKLSNAEKQTALDRIRHIGELGLSSIFCLHSLLPEDHKNEFEDHIIISLLAFTSASDPWTTKVSLDLANRLLSIFRIEILKQEFIMNSVLSSFIRPLFSSSKPKAITTSGYAAISSYTPREPYDFGAWNLTSKPWRLDNCYSLSILSWVVNQASQEVILSVFHLLIPPILILLDSPNAEMQFKGLKILDAFVQKLTPKLLEQTGLGAVIEDAIHPILLYLPPITPLNESLSLLPAAFNSFFVLLEVRFSSSTSNDIRRQDQAKQKLTSLTRLLRQAIAPAYNHTSMSSDSDPIIKKIILAQIPPLVRALGVHSIAHLQTLLQIAEDSLLDPFATASLPTMLAAIKALKEIVLCAWPRLSEERRRRELIRIMVSAWRKIYDDKNNSTEAFKKETLEELKSLGRIFVRAVESSDDLDLSYDLNPLIHIDETLKDLFGVRIDVNE